MSLSDTYVTLSREIAASGARLVAVTKTHPVERIRELYDLGHRDFGENRVSELVEKQAALPQDINWHFIGHLQSKKAKTVAPIAHLIHSGDSLKLLRELDKRAAGNSVDVLLQYHIAREESKYGLTPESGRDLLNDVAREPLRNVRILGVMGMATYTDDQDQVAEEFRTLHEIFSDLKDRYFEDDPKFSEISMGMSGDYRLALDQGSTLIRIGSLLLGERQ
ncbi:YggS family pyridoxal phosphate-dependent enzyme [Lewinella sp. JB7]|uniref:YggS family pyridoxal phosphate-dependent enzyme n=1 Tax=Lewinella sp. JB7 TaxID=2962887 RepID=UPI0020C9E06F|nr:YggS family pyridoxal phosphate-dependent enzyme [Lewinella sp. JB7]MCP9237750.1 YggS family pyridoxal phosphate-dependent enzyme [Lewinella sp. JB7]